MKKCHPLITVSSLISPRVEQSNEHVFSRQSNCFKKRFALAFDNLLAFLETFYSWFFFHPKGPFLYISSNLFFACYLWPCKTNLHVDCKGTHSFAGAVVSHF